MFVFEHYWRKMPSQVSFLWELQNICLENRVYVSIKLHETSLEGLSLTKVMADLNLDIDNVNNYLRVLANWPNPLSRFNFFVISLLLIQSLFQSVT